MPGKPLCALAVGHRGGTLCAPTPVFHLPLTKASGEPRELWRTEGDLRRLEQNADEARSLLCWDWCILGSFPTRVQQFNKSPS